MYVIGKELAGALKAALLFACVDITRESLSCVHVEAIGSALRVVATDGHTLWCSDVPARDSAADPAPAHQAPWNMRIEDAEKIAKLLKDETREIELLLAERTVLGLEYSQATDTFPNYKQLVSSFPTGEPRKRVIPELSACYVGRVAEAFAAYGKGFALAVPKGLKKEERKLAQDARNASLDPPLSCTTLNDELDPVLFFSPKYPAAMAVVMPRKGNGSPSIAGFVERVRKGE